MTKSDFQVDGPSPVSREFGPGLGDGCEVYERERDLPKLIPIYCRYYDIEDDSELDTLRIVVKLTELAEATLEKVTSAHWPCELSHFLAVVSALKAERRNLAVIVARQAAAAAADGLAGKGSRPTDAANAENAAAAVDAAVAKRIRARAAQFGVSPGDIANRLGLTLPQAWKYRSGLGHVSPGRLYQLAKLFGVPVQFFFEDLDPTAAGHVNAFDASEPRGAHSRETRGTA